MSIFKIKIGRDSKHDEQIIDALLGEVILYVDANETLQAEGVMFGSRVWNYFLYRDG